MNYICDCCGQEIEENEYALPFDDYENVCHNECVEDWFNMHMQDVIDELTVYVNEKKC